jgi:glycosyltransferase involved in cell wall biosynthesis
MRIAQLLNSLDIGGAERMVVDLARSLQQRGHSLQIVCLRNSGELSRPLAEAGIEVVALNKNDGFSPSALLRLAQLLKQTRTDVVHTHNPLVHHYGAVAGRMAGVPVIVNTLHGISNFNGSSRTSSIYKLVSPLTDAVVSVCQTAHEFFERRTGIPARKLAIIYNGIPVERFLTAEPRRRREEFVFGTVGRLVPVKDQATLLRAFQKIHHHGCSLDILGDGPLQADLRRLASDLGIADSVRFCGSSLDTPSFMKRIDTFVLSSVSEGLPLTILEALASGLPVVATSVGGIPEIINAAECGWLCPPSQPDMLSQSLLAALQSNDRTEMGLRGQSYVTETYSLTTMAREYECLFENLCRTSSNPTPSRN